MKKYRSLLLLIVFWLCAESVYSQKFPYEEYDPRTLFELVERNSDVTKTQYKEKQMMIDAKPFYSAIRVRFVGTSRPVSTEKKELFKMWQGSLQMDPSLLTLLENEYLFKECDKEYWIPVQKQVAAYFPKELKSGDTITLYLMVVGGLKITDKWDFVFLVNEFRKY